MKHIQKHFDALKCLETTRVSEEGIVGSGTDALRNKELFRLQKQRKKKTETYHKNLCTSWSHERPEGEDTFINGFRFHTQTDFVVLSL